MSTRVSGTTPRQVRAGILPHARLSFSTWKTPRYIVCGELVANRLILPRGTLEACLKLCREAGAPVDLVDRRGAPKGIKTRFRGELLREQKRAATEMLKFEDGVLVAPPGIGKTVIACSIIGKRKTPTLILVHRKALLDQWKSQLIKFLTIDPRKIGILAGNSKRVGGVIDVARIQTHAGDQ
ncbi:MAG: DEAD/DEAH box helicase family protein [Candidatus Aureabacteria bacterium]|nr:DEAD/DEAH box helicase family protein [Candidatus Auribacterota bacterium]